MIAMTKPQNELKRRPRKTKATKAAKAKNKGGRPFLGERVPFRVWLWPHCARTLRTISEERGVTLQQMLNESIEVWLVTEAAKIQRARHARVTAAQEVERIVGGHERLGGTLG
jgi:hypothetical protein